MLCINASWLANGKLCDLLWLELLAIRILGLGLGYQLDVDEDWIASCGVSLPVIVMLCRVGTKTLEGSQTDVEAELIFGC